jgi:hypothetical protein
VHGATCSTTRGIARIEANADRVFEGGVAHRPPQLELLRREGGVIVAPDRLEARDRGGSTSAR